MAISIEVGDITECRVDAIVNAANDFLRPGAGVCGAIHAAGGPAIAHECAHVIASRYPAGVPVGEAVATTAGRLSARWVIHAVGPIFHHETNSDALLADAYRNSLRLAGELGAQSIAFPAISTGIYGFPPERAAGIVWRTLSESAPDLDIRLVFFHERAREIFEANSGGR
jgi:O-acetyl-ADP-ribose deacetylase